MKTFTDFNGAVLKKERILKGFTKEELAEKLGVNRNTIYNWESGRTRPRIDMVRELDFIFGVKDDHWAPKFSCSCDDIVVRGDIQPESLMTKAVFGDSDDIKNYAEFVALETKTDGLIKRIDILESKSESYLNNYDSVEFRLNDVEGRLDDLEEDNMDFDNKIAELDSNVYKQRSLTNVIYIVFIIEGFEKKCLEEEKEVLAVFDSQEKAEQYKGVCEALNDDYWCGHYEIEAFVVG